MFLLSYLQPQKIIQKVCIIFERVRGLDFLSITQVRDFGLDERLVFRGSSSGDRFLIKLFKEMRIVPSDSIIDIGCGKGSALRVMMRFPFKKVDGIEVSEMLAQTADRNLRVLKAKKIEVIIGDARFFQGFGKYNFFYFYNPFPDSVMIEVLRALRMQIGAREAFIIYNNPTCHHLVELAGFRKIGEYPDRWGNGIYVYSSRADNPRFAGVND